ncbi:ShlB/FhaC/HecB family hemolysin secretion/activation protein [Falsiroseomonas oryzae]|uniref:ShlB/FhaC/HecB family hemolysin secretion/activation protein n=1 Tax=Falsiroseomonas oryzae TaxID=2766473 RepID=UPI0022EADA4E|nr:ShlB/FhaC/HecB family hemolysin secretion/activation protein [Roseomonas sp. MO-31]
MRVGSSVGVLLCLAVLAVPASAQRPPPITPELIERLAPPEAPQLAPSLRPAVPEATRGPGDQVRVRVVSVRLTGNEALPERELLPLLQPLVGAEVPLSAIEDARIALISAYGRAGYPFVTASAGVSPVADGVALTMSVVEGRIASVKLDGDIGPAGTQVLRFLDPLVGGGAITTRRLERALLLAGDMPGVTVRSVVRPLQGGESGELELIAQVTRRPFSGYFAVDNRGFRLTGPVQGIFAVGSNSFTSFGERIEASIFRAEEREQTYGQISAEAFAGGSGLRLRAYAGSGVSNPGGFLEQIAYQANTTAAGVAAQYPVIRSRPMNLFAAAQFDYLNTEVEVGSPSVRQSLDRVRALRFGFEGNALDTFFGLAPAPATTTALIRFHQGVPWLDASRPGDLPPPGRVDSNFEFSKWTAELSRSQPVIGLGDGLMLGIFGQVAGQHSGDVLPVTEKFFLGGTRLGRGFYAGQVTGDSAFGATVELQLDVSPRPVPLPASLFPGLEFNPGAQFYLFRDYGRTWENLLTDTGQTIESWGGGVRLFLTDWLQLDLEGVRRLTRRVDATGSTNVPLLDETAGFFRLLTRF